MDVPGGRGAGPGPHPNVQWCSECERYFDVRSPHECQDVELKQNRRKLENWLGSYTIHEEN